MKCSNPACNRETSNPKYCSNSCAATVNNSLVPKRKPTGKCKQCGETRPSGKWYCSEQCKTNAAAARYSLTGYIDKHSNRTLGELKNQYNDQNKYVRVRRNAQITYKYANKLMTCYNCGYDKHVEICHIQPISSFSDETKIKVVNDISNLVALCPNCHWEFDHDLLKLR